MRRTQAADLGTTEQIPYDGRGPALDRAPMGTASRSNPCQCLNKVADVPGRATRQSAAGMGLRKVHGVERVCIPKHCRGRWLQLCHRW